MIIIIIIRVLVISITTIISLTDSASLTVSPVSSLGHQTSTLWIVLLLISTHLTTLGSHSLVSLLLPGALDSEGVGDGQSINVNIFFNVVHSSVKSSLDSRSNTGTFIVSCCSSRVIQVQTHDVLSTIPRIASDGSQHPRILRGWSP